MGAESNFLPEDIENYDSGHAAKHNAVNDQVNFLTQQVSPGGRLSVEGITEDLLASFGGPVRTMQPPSGDPDVDTPRLQAFFDDAPNFGRAVLPFAEQSYKIAEAIVMPGDPANIQGHGVYSRAGSMGPAEITAQWQAINLPLNAPYLSGSVIEVTEPGQHGLVITAAGETVHLSGIGVKFADDIAFQDTGHGFFWDPPARGAAKDMSTIWSTMGDLSVWGHDGDHYAFDMTNVHYANFVGPLMSWGGGGLHYRNFSPTEANFGNFHMPIMRSLMICAGTAHGIYIEADTSLSNLSYPNLLSFGFLQSFAWDVLGLAAEYPIFGNIAAKPNKNVQYCFLAGNNIPYINIAMPDFESGGTDCGVHFPTYGGLTIGQGSVPGGAYPLITGHSATAPGRKLMSDLTITPPAVAGSVVARDTFTRADATELFESESKHRWQVWEGSWAIATNAAKASTVGPNTVALHCGTSDGTLQATLTVFGSDAGLVFRGKNPTNYWRADATRLRKVVNGVETAVGAAYTSFAAGNVVSVVLDGSSITVKVNGTIVRTVTDNEHIDGDAYGLHTYYDTTTRFDSFTVSGL